jgi:hypothetical protein
LENLSADGRIIEGPWRNGVKTKTGLKWLSIETDRVVL